MSEINIKCTPGTLLVKPVDPETEVDGILRPKDQRSLSQEGEVLVVGSVLKDVPSPIYAVGDIVLYRQWVGTQYKSGDENYLFLKFEDVLGYKK